MKKYIKFPVLFCLMSFAACQPPVTFQTPQPADVKAITAFPKRVQGDYLSTDDHSVLHITSNAMIREFDYENRVHASQLDSTVQLIGDTLYDNSSNTAYPVVIQGDTIIQKIHASDTLFIIDALSVLKKYKGYYFANTFQNTVSWEVRKLEFRRGELIIGKINKKEDIDQLKELTESPQDTVPYVFAPTKKEFRNFIGNEGFRDKEILIKIRE